MPKSTMPQPTMPQPTMQPPTTKPNNPNFSSGPCAKHPDWAVSNLADAPVGRSHRAQVGKERLKKAIDLQAEILGIPSNYKVGIVPASDTGAVEMALWSLLGDRGVDILAWESFGSGWLSDITKQLKLKDVRTFEADYGKLPNLFDVDCNRDVVFTWNGTTSGVCVPGGDWIDDNRQGLTICDATSAVFAYDLPWQKLDVITWSWQKALGGEGAHGMIVLSPRAVERLQNYTPPWPLPKIFRMTKGGKLIDGIFTGATINTPSMLAVEDCLDALKWAQSIGGQSAMIKRSEQSLAHLNAWVAKTDWVEFLAEDADIRSRTSICLKIADGVDIPDEVKSTLPKKMATLLEDAHVAYDINGYRDAPAGLRIWAGATVDPDDIKTLTAWLDYAWATVTAEG